MFGLSLPRAKASKTPSASVNRLKEPHCKSSPLAKTLKKLKQVATFGRSNKKSPKTHREVAFSQPITKTASPILYNRALLSNPSDSDRYLAQFPKPKIVYTQAEAKTVVEAFIANAKYEEDLARNTHFSHKVSKPREERPLSWDRTFEDQMASARYSATSEDIRRMQEVPMYEAWQDVTGQVGGQSPKREPARTEPCSITMEEMEMIIQDPAQLDAVWNSTKVGSGSCEYKSTATSQRFSITTDDLEAINHKPLDIDWEGAPAFESWYWELQNMRPWTWSFIAEEMDQPDLERQNAARTQAYLKLVKNNLCDEYPKVF
ncbi:hypothetical protein FS837_010419 [Tulasnella sp. UAMH 9824]|nr:hypothetical protein FS837_010419 [Tulasnella sp. UAMH 9824]